jgi:rhodanese-related sulfurtransferase
VYAGWVTPWGAELVLVADAEGELDGLVAELGSIGIENVGTAVLDGCTEGWTGLRRTDWAGFVSDPPAPGSVVIDVRRPDEWCAGHLPTSRNIPVHELPHRLDEIAGGEVWVHCAAGYRAAVAAGLLDRAGRDVVLVDDDFARVADLGIPLLRGRSAA